MNTNKLVAQLKEKNQDYEWYPTTDEIIEVVKDRLPNDCKSILDIGAGDGRVLIRLADGIEPSPKLYSIEKSPILVQRQPKDIIPVGTDIHEQSLFALNIDYLFCNPIFSEYEDWLVKIISEAYVKKAYIVAPQRWKDSKKIKAKIERREAKVEVIYSGDFLSGDRAARAEVDVLEISFVSYTRQGWEKTYKSPFDIWFDEHVPVFDKEHFEEPETIEALTKKHENSTIPEMVAAYREEYARLVENYENVFKLDLAILQELEITKDKVRDGLKAKMKGLKYKYWDLLFKRLDAIRERLSTRSTNSLMEKLTSNTSIDFTEGNAYSIVLWAIKHANEFVDKQIIELFRDLSTFEGIEKYKSNQRTWINHSWKYKQFGNLNDYKDITHYKLDYRIVVHTWNAMQTNTMYDSQCPGNLHKDAHNTIADIIAVLSNLGFKTYSLHSYDREWKGGKWQDWYDADWDRILFQVKAYLNGNIHIRFLPEAIRAINIEAARLLKWVDNEREAAVEMGYTLRQVKKYWDSNVRLLGANMKLLGASEDNFDNTEVEDESTNQLEMSL